MGKKSVAPPAAWFKINSMKQKPYDPEVYKRLELVRKQFQRHAADHKTEQAATKRQELADRLFSHKQQIIRWAIYACLAGLVLAVIGVTIAEALR